MSALATHRPLQLSFNLGEHTHSLTYSQDKPIMTDASFEDILSKPASEVKPPPMIPEGLYATIIKGPPEYGTAKSGTKFAKFTHALIAPIDVDEAALAEAFPDGLDGTEIDNTYYLTDKALFMLKDFITNCGVEFDGMKSLSTCIDELPNREVIVAIKHDPATDGSGRVFARVGRTLRA